MEVGPKSLAQEAYNLGLLDSLKFNSPVVGGLAAVLTNCQHPRLSSTGRPRETSSYQWD